MGRWLLVNKILCNLLILVMTTQVVRSSTSSIYTHGAERSETSYLYLVDRLGSTDSPYIYTTAHGIFYHTNRDYSRVRAICWGFGLVRPLGYQHGAGGDQALLPQWLNTDDLRRVAPASWTCCAWQRRLGTDPHLQRLSQPRSCQHHFIFPHHTVAKFPGKLDSNSILYDNWNELYSVSLTIAPCLFHVTVN